MKHFLPIICLLVSIYSCKQAKKDVEVKQSQDAPFVRNFEKDSIAGFKRLALTELKAFNEKYEKTWSSKPQSFPYSKADTYRVYQLGRVGECNKCEFKERITSGTVISEFDFQELVSLLENPDSYTNSTAACFNPKVSIIAYDSENVPTEFLSICLNCNNFRSYPGKIQIKHNEKYATGFSSATRKTLRKIFLNWGIDYYGFSPSWDDEEEFDEYMSNKMQH
jgi:hypothetical protein